MGMSLSTDELLAAAGIKSRQTLYAWRNAGLLGEPEVGKSPTGLGRSLHWDDAAVPRCIRIKQLQREGMTFTEIAGQLKIDAGQRKTRKRGTRKKPKEWIYSADGPTVAIGEEVTRAIKHVARFGRDTPAKDLVTLQHLQVAIAYERDGKSPVCVVHSAKVVVMPLEQLSIFLDSFDSPTAVIVVCCRELIRAHLREVKHAVPEDKMKAQRTGTKKHSQSDRDQTSIERRRVHDDRVIDLS